MQNRDRTNPDRNPDRICPTDPRSAPGAPDIGDKFVPELRDIAGRIAELIDLFDEADSILTRTLDDPLSREALGLADAPAAVQPDAGDELSADHD